MALPKEVIVITGVSGRVGTRVAKKFSDPRYVVVGLDIVSPKVSSTNFEFINTDLTSDDSVNRAMSRIREKYGDKIASVIHLASFYDFVGEDWAMLERVVAKGTERLLNAVQSFQTEQFVFSSTMQVHASCEPGQKINENWPIVSSADIQRSKIEADELYLQQKHGNIPLVILRLANCYDDLCHSIPLANHIQRIYERKLVASFYSGDLTHGTSYLHLDDLSDAIWLVVQRRFGLPKDLAFLIGESETVSYGELQKVVGLLIYGEECVTFRIPKWAAKGAIWAQNNLPLLPRTRMESWMIDLADHNYSLDINFVQDKLGWAPKHSMRQTLPKMIHSLKENPLAFYRENGLTIPLEMKK